MHITVGKEGAIVVLDCILAAAVGVQRVVNGHLDPVVMEGMVLPLQSLLLAENIV